MSPQKRKAQREDRRWKYFTDPDYRRSRLEMSREFNRLRQTNPVYREYLNLGRKIWRRRNSIETHERIVERYRKELRKLELEVKRQEAIRAAKIAGVPRGKVVRAGA